MDVLFQNSTPKKLVTGPATQVAKEPFIENTIKIAIICQFEVIPPTLF